MLKIKDNVDLKELEKFGFKFDGWIYVYEQNEFTGVRINPINRKIGIYNSADIIIDKSTLTVIFDLIKADLVEKVDEGKC